MSFLLRRGLFSTSKTMAQQPTEWIFKIFPHASVDSRFYFPTPIPSSHTFFLSELDQKDGMVHLCTAKQTEFVLNNFFKDVPAVTLLRLETGKVSAFKRLRWEHVEDAGQTFPHLFAQLEGVDIESYRDVTQGEGGWSPALAGLKQDWLV